MKTCQSCGGTGRVRSDAGGLALWCTACNGRGEIGGDEPRPWIETHGLVGGYTIYDTGGQWVQIQMPPELSQRVDLLERRVARLETMQRRKPKRKAGR